MIKRIGFTVLAVLALSIAAQAADIDSGTWLFNVAKSTSSDGNLRRSGRQVISMDGGWRIAKHDFVDKDGKSFSGTSEGTDANGKPVSQTWFFDRK